MNIKVVTSRYYSQWQWATLREAANYCASKKDITVDCETRGRKEFKDVPKAGLNPRTGEVIMLQVGDEHTQYVIDCRDFSKETIAKFFKEILEDNTIRKWGVNLKFDYKMIYTNFGIRMRNLKDCMLRSMVLARGLKTPKGYHGLAGMSKRYLNHEYDSPQLDMFDNSSKKIREEFAYVENELFTDDQILYGAYDVIVPILVGRKQELELIQRKLTHYENLEQKFLETLSEVELNGFYLNTDKLIAVYNEKCRLRDEALEQLLEIADINWNSPAQVQTYFLSEGLDIMVLDKKKSVESKVYKPSVAEPVLSKFKDNSTVALYLKMKGAAKAASSWGEKFILNHIDIASGRIHSNYFQIVNTGRLSSSNPNLQNIPSTAEYRSCFTAPAGKKLIVADYSGQELRVLASNANETKMINEFLYGDADLHSLTASMIFGKEIKNIPEHKRERQIGKDTNYLISYGGGAHKLTEKTGVTVKRANEIIKTFLEKFPALNKYFTEGRELAKKRGFIHINDITNSQTLVQGYDKFVQYQSFINRMINMGWKDAIPSSVWKFYFTKKGEIERNSQNYPIQGTSAEMVKLAAHYFTQWIRENNLWEAVKIVNLVHDEIVVECNEHLAEEVEEKLVECALKAGAAFSKVPMDITVEATNYWNH